MTDKRLPPVHPGEVPLEEFLKPLGLSQNRLGLNIGVHPRCINEIVLRKRGVTAETALRLARYTEPVRGMLLRTDRGRLEGVLAEARTWPGVFDVRGWANEGALAVGDDIMKVLVAGDVRGNVFAALGRLVALMKNAVVSESELLSKPEAR